MAAPEKKRFPVIGLVGGIGAGKTETADRFAARGCAVIDADRIGHELLADQSVRDRMRAAWGEEPFRDDGSVDRRRVADRVFADPAARRTLEGILHPRMRQRIADLIAAARASGAPAAVIDAAVLFEAGWDALCTHTVFVDAPRDLRLARVRDQRGWSAKELGVRESSQIPLDKKKERCSHVAVNKSDGSRLSELVGDIFHNIVSDS